MLNNTAWEFKIFYTAAARMEWMEALFIFTAVVSFVVVVVVVVVRLSYRTGMKT